MDEAGEGCDSEEELQGPGKTWLSHAGKTGGDLLVYSLRLEMWKLNSQWGRQYL